MKNISSAYFSQPDEAFHVRPAIDPSSIEIVTSQPGEDPDFVELQAEAAREYKGRFQKGYDPRRHRLTHEERVRGGREAFRKVVFEILPMRYNDGRAATFLKWAKGGAR